MSRRSRRNHSPAYRARAALTAIEGDTTYSLLPRGSMCPTQITQWQATLRKRAADLIEEWFPAVGAAGRPQPWTLPTSQHTREGLIRGALAQHSDDLGRERFVQQLEDGLAVRRMASSNVAPHNVPRRALTQDQHVG